MTAKPKWVIGKWFPLPDADKRVMKYWRRGDRYDNTGTWVEVDELATVTTWPTKKAAHEAFRMHGPRLNRFPGSVDEIRVLKLSDVTTVQLPAEMVETLLNEEAAAITAKRSGHDNRSAKIEARQAWAAEQQIEPGYRALDQDIRAMAKTIATDLVEFGRLIERAKTEHLWERLGFKSWTAYIADVVGRNMKVLPVEDRRQIVAFLDDEGMSQRAIAAAVGVSQKTVDRDLDELSHDDSVADDDDELAPVLTIVKERRTGLDGKSRPAHPQERTRTPLPRTIAMRKAHASLATIEGAVGQLEEAITELAEAGWPRWQVRLRGAVGRHRRSAAEGRGQARRGRVVKRIIGLLVLAALLIKFWPWILAAVLLWWVIKADLQVLEESRTERAARAAVDGWSGVLGL